MINRVTISTATCLSIIAVCAIERQVIKTEEIVVQQARTIAALTEVVQVQQVQLAQIEQRALEVQEFIVRTTEQIRYTPEDLNCLARNIYHEAGIEHNDGKYAVAQVTLNRLKDGRWGNTICKVVYAKAQFSWTLSKKKVAEKPKGALWEDSLDVAHKVLAGDRIPTLAKSLWYHADYIANPKWVPSVVKTQQIGQHIFYQSNT